MEAENITKIEAAQRQLDTAIEMFFADMDNLSIQTLAHAAFRVLYDLSKREENGSAHKIDSEIKFGINNLATVPNWLKHADRDPEAILIEHKSEYIIPYIGLSCGLYRDLTGSLTKPMKAFHFWAKTLYLDDVAEKNDLTKKEKMGIEIIKSSDWDVKILPGKALLQIFKEEK